ncbi:bifunctional phosphoribosyl-AMP cyclohydrolase/phosphoribosyl-ATP diphosphatase HisIE [Brevibacillus formosus]|uniref:bifunctional phosphoribosyl-AMP cyclohydrolase/phosphoribosyl-ATP diphosphatase HisIE n=1 Tax=Brevibacillus TaxID=55080 RepID=UPI000D11262A|nr:MULTISPECIES: bifunctional phosphoribosyl-AMP cyclohydrolase/phosphoribosyl-ATP diphosphatase HisIE [Brevibacillus]MBG9940440.1 phosphoribosyl-ATP pyrophosphatase [Brevibacillus formosus]MED1944631.1 bifunctional phosphoribosyl-AMP cyclohydrolase/phosphoribosyl-ATP diphosphatase HisIE [Brevibacillus formosus]MED1996682.1 bifunctional phosphoribosyl-AMP cyclohydrolase/phosphoribosyl-ATP diphosphatase HisIE [Brevibacillus formosus]MED2081651.1 bifunctional phosphoribosyl-AMP cyclohydrolase/pho
MTGAEAFAVEKLRFDDKGLIPVIVQDAGSKTVLTLAYMNEESLQKSLATKETWFWSRSRQQLWHKGETSGHTQRIVSMRYDCDGDALVVMVEPNGPACHTGAYSCFSQEVLTDTDEEPVQADRFAILSELEELIAAREAERPEGSYTTYLFEKGVDKILKKVGEEAAEVIIAAKNRSREELRYEASDLIFHLMVLLREQKLPLDEVLTELQRRR